MVKRFIELNLHACIIQLYRIYDLIYSYIKLKKNNRENKILQQNITKVDKKEWTKTLFWFAFY
jgi:hypothetical protein